jgi:hypothetical protein
VSALYDLAADMTVLRFVYRSARRIGARYGRWRQAAAVAGTLPTRTSWKDPARV